MKCLKLAHLFCACLFMSLTQSFSQPDTSTTDKLLHYIMQPLDRLQIPTGFLEEWGAPMLPMATFKGTLTDSNRIDMHLWRTLYFQLQTGYVGSSSNPLPSIVSVNNTIKQYSYDTLPVPIPLIIGQYNNVRGDAFSNNLLSYNSNTNQVSDVSYRSQSPYNTNNLFAACPTKKQSLTGSETFIVPANLIWNNTGKSISLLQIDFANGQGFQSVSTGTPISVTYSDTGYKKWTIKAILNDNSVLQCNNDYYVLTAANTGARYQIANTVVPFWGFITPINGVHSGAIVTVTYSRLNNTNTLRKPLIVAEGYDVSFRARSLQPNYNVGDFIRGLNEPQGYDFNHQLDDIAGYDLVFIDFNDGADGIVRNAAIVQEVINRVNANKVLDDRFGNIRQQNVVMGLSMGGLCTRYALANMTKNFPGTPTETRLLITHDSPHRGANVPLGLQYMIRMLGGVQLFGTNVYDIYPDYDDAINLLNAPATQDLLLYRSVTANTFNNNTFLDATYRPMITFASTDPQPSYRFIATSLGNECANPLFSPGSTFVNLGAGVSAGIDARFLFFRVPIVSYKLAAEVEAYALPNAGSTNKIARVYTINNLRLFGFINIFRQLYNNTAYAPGNHLAVDGVPGSNYPLLDVQALNQITNLPVFAASLYVSFPLGPFLSGYFGAYAYNQGVSYKFTFVPVASALDAGSYSTPIFSQKYVNGTNQNYPSTSETFIAQETVQNNPATTNNIHIRFTARNSEWLYNEMENRPNNLNCSGECSNPFYIVGSDIICSSEVYSVPNLPRGATVHWDASPSDIVTINSPDAPQTSIDKYDNGIITLTATISNACGSGTTTITKQNITVGVPTTVTGYYASGSYGATGSFPLQLSGDGNNEIRNDNVYYTTLYASITAPNTENSSMVLVQSSPGCFVNGYYWHYIHNRYFGELSLLMPQNSWALFRLTMPNSCGDGTFDYLYEAGPGGNFRMSPNPARDIVVVKVDEEELAKQKITKSNNQDIREIDIADKVGNILQRKTFGKGVRNVNLNVSMLKPDIYLAKIFNGKTWTTLRFLKQ